MDLRDVERGAAVVCGQACAQRNGPVLRLSGTHVDELEVLTRTEAGLG